MTTPSPFKQPAKNSGFFSPRDHADWLGRLFLIYPDRVTSKTFQQDEGPVDMVEADVVIIDLMDPQTGQPTVLAGTTIGGKALVPQLKTQLGAMVLGRLTQSPAQGQKSGAYYLADFSDQDAAGAQQYIATHPRQQFAQPQAGPTQAPYGAAPQPAYGQAPAAPSYGSAPAPAPSGNGHPQYASAQLPYDPWQNTQAAPQAAPAGPPQGQWGAAASAPVQAPAAQAAPPMTGGAPAPQPWGVPAPSPAPSAPAANPAQAAPAAPLDPQLAAFLQSKGVNPEGMTDGQARMIAATYGA
ncbi:hypothetical protein [Streptomyces sp. OK228]|uniref:hypothetical protein n=1 Tax=Streptomyces sp. OK228 TaxID=1882786 RepID=UPI000BCC8290|nr:hypothetical protein [Streptomyces sp. OK228]SOE25681.1 hypothetical protein SAMN05442782_2425 [Streptomyces sp. OK228]